MAKSPPALGRADMCTKFFPSLEAVVPADGRYFGAAGLSDLVTASVIHY